MCIYYSRSIGVELFAKVLLSRPYTLEVITKSYAELVRGLITASYSGLELLSNCLGMAISTKLYDHYFQPAILSTLSNHFKSLGGLFCASSASIQTLLETVYIESNRLVGIQCIVHFFSLLLLIISRSL